MKQTAQSILILFLVLSLSACGFKLRGSESGVKVVNLPKNIYITGADKYSDLYKEITRQLRYSNSVVSASIDNADALLTISHRASEKRSVAVNSSNDDAEYELKEKLSFMLRSAEGELVPIQDVSVIRILYSPNTETLSGNNEEALLRKEMTRQMVNQMMRRMSVLMK